MPMKKKYISSGAPASVIEYVRSLGYEVSLVEAGGDILSPVSSHPDIRMCRLGISDDAPIVFAEAGELGTEYPEDIRYNACCTGKYFIHKLKETSPRLLSRARELGMELIDVKQGYARCSCVPVDENSIITYDQGIAHTCQKLGLNVLAVSPGHVNLPGYETGFIGGTAGAFDDEILLAGNVINHPDGEMIIRFIEERGKRIKYFKDFPLTDIGSVI